MKNNGERSFLKDFLNLGIGTFLYMIIGLIGTPIITRLVAPTDYGQMSIISVYSNIGMMLCGLGLDQTLVRYFYKDKSLEFQSKLLRRCFLLPIAIATGVGVLLLICHLFELKWLSLTELVLLEINVIALIISRFSTLILRLRYRSNAYSAVNIIQKATYILMVVALVFLWDGQHFLILAISTIVSTFLSALIAIAIEKKIWFAAAPEYSFPILQSELLKYSIPIMISSGISVIFNGLDKLFIERYCTLADVGIYASAMNLVGIFSIIKTAFNAIWMPSAVDHYENNPEDVSFFQRGNSFISIVMLCFGAAVILFKDLFVLLLGEEYQAASMILPYLMFEPIMYTISETTATGIVVQKKSVYQVVVAGGSCIVNFIGNLILTPLLGPQGAALSTGVSYIVFFALRTILANRVFRVDYQLHRFIPSVIALFGFAVYGSNHAFSWLTAVIFVVVMAVILISYRKDVNEAAKYAGKLVKKILKK